MGQAVSAWTVPGVGVESAGLTAAGRITPAQAVEVETCSTTTQRVGREALPYWWPWCSRSFCFCFAGSGGLRASRMCHRTHLAACLQSFPSRACAAALVEKALGITGDSILYVGDHICEQGGGQQRYSEQAAAQQLGGLANCLLASAAVCFAHSASIRQTSAAVSARPLTFLVPFLTWFCSFVDTDAALAKMKLNWRTALVIAELELEIEALAQGRQHRQQLKVGCLVPSCVPGRAP